VGRGRAWLGSLLDIKPVLDIDAEGKLVPIAKVRGRKSVLPKMMEILEQKVPRNTKKVRFGVMHVACPDAVDEVCGEIRKRYGRDREIIVGPGTPIIATHAGGGAWGIAYLVED
jgi:DegV family protein with EDD domain